jgi:hypothetical protein
MLPGKRPSGIQSYARLAYAVRPDLKSLFNFQA